MELTPRMQASALAARAAAAGSMVLLKNSDHTLPFSAGADVMPVAVFGVGQVLTAFCSDPMQPWRACTILDALSSGALLAPDALLARKYRAWALAHPDGSELPADTLCVQQSAETNDAAIVVVTRRAGEYDVHLSENERLLFRAVLSAFSRTVLILNTPGYIELDEQAMRFGAIVYMGLAGQEGSHALYDLLCARAFPCGRLAHTWPLYAEALDAQPGGLWRGYRYYDSAGEPVRFPFGFGLSYGCCEIVSYSVGLDRAEVIVTAEVENTDSTYPAQEVVQVYLSCPSSGSTSPLWILDCYQKTRLLTPGEKERIELRFPVSEMSVFHEEASAYVLEAGYYDVRIGTDSRSSRIAGSVLVVRNAVMQAVSPLNMKAAPQPSPTFVFPDEEQQRQLAHSRAIRLSDRALPRLSRKKGRSFTGCRSDGAEHTFEDVKNGVCNLFHLVAAMDDHSLLRLVSGFGDQPGAAPGSVCATPALARYGIPAMTLAGGCCGLALEKEITDEDGVIVRRQLCTAFPAPGLLACSFDPGLIRQIGLAVGAEMREYGVQLWLGPGAQPTSATQSGGWSEDPVVCGVCAAACAQGVQPNGAAVLHDSAAPRDVQLTRRAYEEYYALPFAIAASSHSVCLLQDLCLDGEILGEDSPIVRAMMTDWKYTGMFLAGGERYSREPGRVALERSALRILRTLLRFS